MSLTTKSVAQQLAMGDTIRQIVSQKVVAEREKSIDILLGMICYLAWSQYHKKDRPYMIMWTQLAVALIFELGIHKAPAGDEEQFSAKYTRFPLRLPVPPMRTMEERAWTSLRQMVPLRWTPYMDDCVCILSEEKETELDILLATQVKCHVIMDQMTRSPAEQAAEGEVSKVPPPYFIRAMQFQLQDVQRNLPVEMQSNRAILLDMYSTDIIVKEALLHRPRVRDQTSLSNLQRLEGLDSLLTAIERWLDIFQDVPLIDCIGMTFSIHAQFSHYITLLFKLTTLDEPGWDIDGVKKRADLLDILERLAQRIESIPSLLGMVDAVGTGESGLFFKSSRLIRGMKASFSADMGPPTSLQMDVPPNGNSDTAEFIGESSVPDDVTLRFADDPWLMDFLCLHGTFDL